LAAVATLDLDLGGGLELGADSAPVLQPADLELRFERVALVIEARLLLVLAVLAIVVVVLLVVVVVPAVPIPIALLVVVVVPAVLVVVVPAARLAVTGHRDRGQQ